MQREGKGKREEAQAWAKLPDGRGEHTGGPPVTKKRGEL